MLASFAELLKDYRQQGVALGAFTCYNLETASGVLEAGVRRESGVILLISEKSFRSPHGPYLVAALQAVAQHAPIPVCLQLDHVSDLALIELAFQSGVGAVMADGSDLPLDENIKFVREAGAIAQRYGGSVEAELGRIEGNEDIAVATAAGALTDPQQAARFIDQTRPACLAVSIGNVHGVYQHLPVLDWDRLREIRLTVDVPLSLHGASGLENADLKRAISLGISKINVNTELRSRYLEVTAEELDRLAAGARVLELNLIQAEAVAEVAAKKIEVYKRSTSLSSQNR